MTYLRTGLPSASRTDHSAHRPGAGESGARWPRWRPGAGTTSPSTRAVPGKVGRGRVPYRLMIRSADHWTPACVPVDIRPPACRRSPGRTKSMEAILRVAQLTDEPRQARSAQQMPMRPGSGRLAKCLMCGCSAAPPDAAQHADYGPTARPQQIAHAYRRCVRIRLVRGAPAVSMYAGAMVRIQAQWPPMDADDLHSPESTGPALARPSLPSAMR
jgi:hypothetical protein